MIGGKQMSNRFWTDKTDGVDNIVAEDFNSAFDGVVADMDKKADKQTANGGFAGGNNASATHGGAIGNYSNATWGGAVGYHAKALEGGAVGNNAGAASGGAIGRSAKSTDGGAVGAGAKTSNGFAGGKSAQAVDSDGNGIDAIQLGTGTNNNEKTLQVYDYQLMNASGNIPVERLTELKKLSVPHTTASGYPVSVSDHLEGERVIDYKVYGNSVQDGTPTPDTPIEIQSVGDLVTDTSSPYYGKYDVPVTVRGKNLIPYPYKDTSGTAGGITITINNDGTITANGTASADRTFTIAQYIIQSGTYTLSGTKNGSLSTYYMGISGTSCRDVGNGSSVTFDTERTILIYISVKSGATLSNVVFKPQLEFGSTATPYEPHQEPITKHIYLDEPLYNLDYVDYGNGFFVNKICVIDDFSNITFNYVSNSNYFQTTSISGFYADATLRTNSLCNYFKYGDARSSDCFWIDSSGRGLRIKTDKYDGTTVAEFNEWIKSIPIKIYYPLATPTTEPITAPDFDVPNSAVMNISSGTVIPPSSMDVTYYQDINKVITELKNAILAQGGNV